MKRILILISTIISVIFLFTVTACKSELNDSLKAQETKDATQIQNTAETGSASFSIVVPDYYAMIDSSRIIAPDTVTIQLLYQTANGNIKQRVNLSYAEKTAIPNAPQGFIGSVYKVCFDNIPSGNYSPGKMRVSLWNSNDIAITSGANEQTIIIESGKTTKASFYMLPYQYDSDYGSLAAGEMKFLKKQLDATKGYVMTITVPDGKPYPDVVIFNDKGVFEKYVSISADNNTVDLTEYKGMTKYFGFWSATATSYTAGFGYSFSDSTVAGLTSINQTFNSTLDSKMWITSGVSAKIIDKDPIFAKWAQTKSENGGALIDTHGKVFKLCTWENGVLGKSSLEIYKISVQEESAVSFDYKCDLYESHYFKVYVDGNPTPVFKTTGIGEGWQKGSVVFGKGNHTVVFSVENAVQKYASCTNSVYLDNITLAPNKTVSVDISPKGLQETYVNGNTIQFTAKALRSDGSVISGKTAVWAVSENGGTISSDGLYTPGTSDGMVTVSATIDEKTGSNQTVKVHGQNYLLDPVTINGHTFTGEVTNGSGSRGSNSTVTWQDPTPIYTNFTTDGFFVIKGNTSKWLYIVITKTGCPYETFYFIPKGDFEKRIWLRFGDGEYKVRIYPVTEMLKNDDYDGYEGELLSWSFSGSSVAEFQVKNQTGLDWSAEQCAYLMPSYICQSDDFVVSNVFNSVIAELPQNATLGQKMQALHDWEIHTFHYDNVSLNTYKRKKQDAVSVVKYEMAVCEGYANLYAAFARLLGVQVAYQISNSMNHAWVECLYNNEWKLVDVTHDDPVASKDVDDVRKYPHAENYKYFLVARTGVDNDHVGNETQYNRSAGVTEPVAPEIKGVPAGWY